MCIWWKLSVEHVSLCIIKSNILILLYQPTTAKSGAHAHTRMKWKGERTEQNRNEEKNYDKTKQQRERDRERECEFENIFWGSRSEFRVLNNNILQTIIIRIIKSFFLLAHTIKTHRRDLKAMPLVHCTGCTSFIYALYSQNLFICMYRLLLFFVLCACV